MINTQQMAEVIRPGLQKVFDEAFAKWQLQKDMDRFFSGAHSDIMVNALPRVDVPVSAALAFGAAAVVVKNPTVERRRLFAWFGGGG